MAKRRRGALPLLRSLFSISQGSYREEVANVMDTTLATGHLKRDNVGLTRDCIAIGMLAIFISRGGCL
jgi:hypothetical protein